LGAGVVPPEVRDAARPSRAASSDGDGRTFVEQKAEAERQIIVAALEQYGWHISRTAQALGLADHSSLLKIMRRHGVVRPDT
jgi:transcriptional regulator with GAF, ATPase, and Fis domain